MFTCNDMENLLASKIDLETMKQQKIDNDAPMKREEIYSLFSEGNKLPWNIRNFVSDNYYMYRSGTITTIAELKKSSYRSNPDDCLVVSAIKDGGINKLYIRCNENKEDKNRNYRIEFSIQLMPKTGNKQYTMTEELYKDNLNSFEQVKNEINKFIDKWNKEIGPNKLKEYTEKYKDWSIDSKTAELYGRDG